MCRGDTRQMSGRGWTQGGGAEVDMAPEGMVRTLTCTETTRVQVT